MPESIIAILSEIFPGISNDIIKNALDSSDNDIKLASSIIISHDKMENEIGGISTIETELAKYYDMFPNINQEYINKIYEKIDDNEDILEELLNFELLVIETKKERQQSEMVIHDTLIENKNESKPISAWTSRSTPVELIMEYTSVTEDISKHHYFENGHDFILAIISIIDLYTTEQKNESENKDENSRTVIPQNQGKRIVQGGRVQGNGNFSHLKSKASSKKENIFVNLQNDNEIDVKDSSKKYNKYRLNSLQDEELNDIIKRDPKNKLINKKILRKSLMFYEGNLNNVLRLVTLLIENNYTHLTLPVKSTMALKSIQSSVNITHSSFQGFKRINSTYPTSPSKKNMKNRIIPNKGFSSIDNYKKAYLMIENLFISNKLDFHGFYPNEVILILHKCLNMWWDKELETRELNAQSYKNPKALNIQPLVIITGRGIHSVGGVSKVRIQVKAYLDKIKYIYWEEPSYFTVEGKKQK